MSDTINIGGVTVSKFYLGGSSDVKIFLGTTKLYPNAIKDYLRTVAKSSGTISLTIGSAVTTTDLSYVAYSLDSGDTWTTVNNADNTTVTASTSVSNGDVVYWKGVGTRTAIAAPSLSGGVPKATIFSSDVNFDVEGNAMSMLFGDNFENQEFDSGSTYHLCGLFYNNTHLINASGMTLPAATVYENDYNDMFNGCSGLTSTPQLPATTLGASCYKRMFRACRVLSSAPSILPATTLAEQCYYGMFSGCWALTTPPQLPATTLAYRCYYQMFAFCSGLTSTPDLPATTLAYECYVSMFAECSSLTTAPYLPATTLVMGCYTYMFSGCTSLNRIECNADTYYSSATASTGYWVSGVAASGKFIKNSSNTWWTTGNSGIPTNWSVGTLPAERRDWVKADVSDYVCVGYDKHYKEYIEDTTDGGITWAIVTPVTSRTSEDVIEYNSTDCGYRPAYFTITSLGVDNTITLKNNTTGTTVGTTSFNYSTDGGQTWTSFSLATGQTKTIATLNEGDTLMMYGTNTTLGTAYNYGHFFRATGDYEVSGELSSLVNGSDVTDTYIASGTSRTNTFAQLFSGDTHLVSAENLKISSTALPQNCCNGLFRGCTSLVKAPTTLPATDLGRECYSSMFEECTSLAYPPKELNFTSVQSNSYNRMFCMNRNSKVTAAMTYTPKMFGNWGSVNPATSNMQMFCGNGNLTNIYCYWTNTSGTFGNIANWVNYTADSGVTFYKRSTQSFASGVNGIKTGWTVVNDDSTQPT